jgi:hypothetical protein
MDRDGTSRANWRRAQPDQHLTTIADYRYLAPRIMALHEDREQVVSDIALSRLLATLGPVIERDQRVEMARRLVGDFLIRLGTRLQGVHHLTPAPAATPGPEPAAR